MMPTGITCIALGALLMALSIPIGALGIVIGCFCLVVFPATSEPEFSMTITEAPTTWTYSECRDVVLKEQHRTVGLRQTRIMHRR